MTVWLDHIYINCGKLASINREKVKTTSILHMLQLTDVVKLEYFSS